MLPEDSKAGWTQKVTNEELYRKIQLTETLLQKVIQRKLRLFGHICRMNDSRKIKETKLSILKTCVFSTMLYGCETWTVTKRCENRILYFERKCYRKILRQDGHKRSLTKNCTERFN